MTVEIRQGGNEWLVEVRGEPIGVAESLTEARALADYWEARLACIARWRGIPAASAAPAAAVAPLHACGGADQLSGRQRTVDKVCERQPRNVAQGPSLPNKTHKTGFTVDAPSPLLRPAPIRRIMQHLAVWASWFAHHFGMGCALALGGARSGATREPRSSQLDDGSAVGVDSAAFGCRRSGANSWRQPKLGSTGLGVKRERFLGRDISSDRHSRLRDG